MASCLDDKKYIEYLVWERSKQGFGDSYKVIKEYERKQEKRNIRRLKLKGVM